MSRTYKDRMRQFFRDERRKEYPVERDDAGYTLEEIAWFRAPMKDAQ